LLFWLQEEIIHHAEAYISTEQSPPRQDTRLSRTHGDQERSSRAEETAREGSQAVDTGTLLSSNGVSPRRANLRKSAEFRCVYEGGKRFDGRLMTAFVLPNHFGHHRLGITASRRASRSAVERNRMKRLLREAFRLSEATLQGTETYYDWVLNTKRSLLRVKLADSMAEFQRIISAVAEDERASSRRDEQLKS
jgi:ribonuclease P protein component